MPDTDFADLAARADVCRLLAACYYEPQPEFAQDGLFTALQAACARCDPQAERVAIELGSAFAAASDEELLVDYTRLFLNPGGALASPYESTWLGERDPVRAQRITDAVTACYDEAGLQISDDFRDLPDHIAAELEMLYALLFREARAAAAGEPAARSAAGDQRRRFVAAHLGRWIQPFAQSVREGAMTRFYLRLVDVTQNCVEREAR